MATQLMELDVSVRRRLALRGVVKLNGQTIHSYPEKPRVVRIFTSSTFTDTAEERNALMASVYPNLKSFCRKLGYEFQVVDMRWGVRDEATDDHLTVELCMKELRKCQETSTGPNFVTFLGQKYGYRPIPRAIAANEFELFLAVVESDSTKALLKTWYHLDKNELTSPVYVLQPIGSRYRHYNDVDPENRDLRESDREQWWSDFQQMQAALRKAASSCLEPPRSQKYFMSVTEEEIRQGIVEVGRSSERYCLWFARSFPNLTASVSDPRAGSYIDKDWTHGTVDKTAQQLLEELKTSAIPSVLPGENTERFEIDWTGNGVDPGSNIQHAAYVDELCLRFESRVKDMISRAVCERSAGKLFPDDDLLLAEVVAHVNQCLVACRSFTGREYVLSKLQDRLMSNSPCVLYGPPGIGRSAIAARVAYSVSERWSHEMVNGALVIRFIGTTPQSSSTPELLGSVCEQLKEIYGNDDFIVPRRSKGLYDVFHKCLHLASREQPLLVVLDGAELLHSSLTGTSDRYEWLPTTLPDGIQLLLTACTVDSDSEVNTTSSSLDVLKSILPSDSFVEVPPLSQAESMSILDVWLHSAGRTLTEFQRFDASKAVNNCLVPLYVTLVAKHCSKWQSTTFPSPQHVLHPSMEGLIVSFLKQLEVRHGRMLVSHALAVVTAAREGISESELEDILSCDEAVLDDVYQYWIPPLRRLPPMLWLRIQADLDDYLVKRGHRGIQLLAWRHQSFCHAVRRRYLQSDDHRMRAHSAISDYFLGLWAGGQAKPYRKEDESVQLSDRAVAQQPLAFNEDTTNKQYNYRKLVELPHNLCHSGRLSQLKSEVLCSYQFLYTKLEAFSLSALLDDFRLALAMYPGDRELTVLQETLLISGACLDKRPSELAGQLIGRLTATVVNEDVYLEKLLKEALRPEKLSLIPTSACLTPPGCRLRMVMAGHKGEVSCVAISTNNTTGLSVAGDYKLKQWDITSGVCLLTIKVITTSIPIFVAFTHSDTCAVVANIEGTVEAWQLLTSRRLYQTTTVKKAEHFAVSSDQQWLAVASHKEVCVLETTTGNMMWKQDNLKHPSDMTITFDAVVVAIGGRCPGLLNFPLYNPKDCGFRMFSAEDNPMCLACHGMTNKLYMLSSKSKKVQCYDVGIGALSELDFCSISHAEKLVVTDNDGTFLALRHGQLMMLTEAGLTTVCVQHGYISTFACNNSSCIVTGSTSSLVCVFDLVNYHQEIQLLSSKRRVPVDYIRSGRNCDAFIALGTDESKPLGTGGHRLTHLTVWRGTGDLVSQFCLKHHVKRFTVLSQHQVLLLCRRHLVVVNLVSGSVEHVIKGQTGRYLYDINVDKNSNLVVLSKGRRNLKIVDVLAEHAVEIIKIISDDEKKDRLSSVLVSTSGNVAICCQENWSTTLISQGDTGPIHVVDLIRKELFTIRVDQEYSFSGSSVSPSGQWLALAMQTHIEEDQLHSSGFQLYNLTEKIKAGLLSNGSVEPYKSTWSPCNQILITSWWDCSIRLWCSVTGQQLAVFKQHEDAVAKLTVSQEMLLLSACESSVDHQLCVWSLVDFSLVSSFTPDECPKEVTVTDSGSFLSYCTMSQGLVTMSLSSRSDKSSPQSQSDSSNIVRRSIQVSFSAKEHHDPDDIDTDSDISDV